MAPIATSRIALLAGILIVLVGIGVFVWRAHPGHLVADWTGRFLTPASLAMHRGVAFGETFLSRRDLTSENIRLADALASANANTAQLEAAEQENIFLRAAAGLRAHVSKVATEASVFSYVRTGGIRQMIVNQGSRDGVAVRDIVMTGHGELIGVVAEVFDHHAVVRCVGDPGLEVTARIMGSEVLGLIHPDSAEGVLLDLVQKSETVTEGQVVVTSGNDQFPAGIIIGTVKSVDNNSASLFKIVRVAPKIDELFSGRVLIMHP